MFFMFGGLGVIFGGYALYHAIRLKSLGSQYGIAAIAISATALGLVVIGWAYRLSGI